MSNYPKRSSHFAHKAFRLMHKSSLAATIGRDAFCIIAVVLHTEDAARYRGPVRYFNSQLMETLGFAKWESFNRARIKAIESGWLNYSGDGKRSAGLYFVTVPDGYELIDDSPMEETLSPADGYKQGYKEGYKRGYDEGIKGGINRGQWGVQPGDKGGEPYYPIPLPNPNPIPFPDSSIVSNETIEPPILIFNCNGNQKDWWLTQSQVSKWKEAYPGLDVLSECRKAMAWTEANTKKTARGMKRFLVSWLSKANDRGTTQRQPQKQLRLSEVT